MGLCASNQQAGGTEFSTPSTKGENIPDLPEPSSEAGSTKSPGVQSGVPPPVKRDGLKPARERMSTPGAGLSNLSGLSSLSGLVVQGISGLSPQEDDPLTRMFSRHANPVAAKTTQDAHGHVSYRHLPGYEPAGKEAGAKALSDDEREEEEDQLLRMFSRFADEVPADVKGQPAAGELIHLSRTEDAPVGATTDQAALASILGNASAPLQSGSIRPFNPHSNDKHAAYGVCLRTGDNGKDASDLYVDHEAIGNRWCGPYLERNPDLAFLLEVDGEVVGYVLGCLDTKPFYEWATNAWCVERRAECPNPEGDPSAFSKDEEIYSFFHSPNYMPPPAELDDYPCHLHIDIVEKAQRKGWGTKMIKQLFEAMKRRGSKGVHLEMWSTNPGAYKFYMKMGFKELLRTTADYKPLGNGDGDKAHIIFLGKDLQNKSE